MEKRIVIDNVETNYVACEDGTIKNATNGRVLNGTITREGYKRVQLSLNGKPKTLLVHKLVAETFIPNPDGYRYIKHKDGDKSNNAVDNLYWNNTPSTKEEEFRGSKEQEELPSISYKEVLNSDNWRPLEFDDFYYVSKTGLVFSMKTRKLLSLREREGYKRVRLGNKYYTVHRLVYQTFVEPLGDRDEIDHINNDRGDNRLENLRKVSRGENMTHAQQSGHKGQRKVAQYDIDGNFIKEYPSFTAAAQEMGVTYAAISGAARRNGTSCGYKWKVVE